jgi:hypothetical protein
LPEPVQLSLPFAEPPAEERRGATTFQPGAAQFVESINVIKNPTSGILDNVDPNGEVGIVADPLEPPAAAIARLAAAFREDDPDELEVLFPRKGLNDDQDHG